MMAVTSAPSGKNIEQEFLHTTAWLMSVLLAVSWTPAIGLWVAQFLYSEKKGMLSHCLSRPALKPERKRRGKKVGDKRQLKVIKLYALWQHVPKSSGFLPYIVSEIMQAIHLIWRLLIVEFIFTFVFNCKIHTNWILFLF